MAKTVDDRVVSASFETSKFEAGTQKMLSSLDKLKKSIDFKNAGKGLDQINASANRVNLSNISKGVDEIKGKFGALRLTAIATLAGIATKAVNVGAQFVKQFTFAPVIDGLHEYENQLNSVQTILGNTKDAGTNLKDVNGALNQLNKYADKTIYNFGQMTKNVGTFTAAGVDLKTSVASIKGISNLAALSGSSAEQASTAMYQLSQAISAGRVGLQDWNSVVNAGMGGAVFQKSLMRTAENMGALKDGAVEIDKATGKATINGESFRESIMAKPGQKSWLTGDVLTSTLKQLSGDMTTAQLKAEGFSDAQIKAIQTQSKMALDAATKVKTFSQLVDTTKEAIGSGWAQSFQIILGDFGEAKKLFTGLAGFIGGFVNKQSNARNKMLKDWKAAGGRATLITTFKQAFEDLSKVLGPIGKAFRDVFPKRTGGQLASLTRSLLRFTQALEPSKETVDNLHRTFRGLFAVLDIGKMIIGGILSVIGKLFGAVGSGSGGILKLTGNWGDWVYALDQSLKKTGAINKFFGRLGTILQTPIKLLKELGHAISEAFSGNVIGKAGSSMTFIERVIENVTVAWDKFIGSISGAPGVLKPALDGISQMFGGIGETIAEALKGADFDAIFKVIEVGLLGGIFLTLRKTLSGGLGNALAGGVLKSVVQAFTGVGGLTRSIGGTFNALTGSITTMQQNVKSDTLKNIAISIALLAGSMIGLSLVDPKRLNGALSAITIGFGQLLGAMAIMDKIGKSGGFIKMPVIAGTMVILAVAIDLLAVAVAGLSRLSWEELAKGLGAVSVLLIGISAASGPLSANSAGMIRAGVGITVISVAMNILARAVKSFGSMDTETLAKGIGGISIALAGIGAASKLFPTGMVAIGVGLIAVGAGLKIIAGVVQTLGATDTKVLAKGIGSIAIALGAIGLAMRLMPGPSMVITAAGLILVGIALKSISKTVKSFGGMSITEIAKGIGALALALGVLAIGLYAMSGTLAGSASLAVAAAGLALLAPALKTLGDQSWTQIIKGMVALAVALGLLGVAGLVLAPVTPAILALGVALVAVGLGLALAGAGVALIGLGLAEMAVAGPAAIAILVSALVKISEALPKVVANLAKALVGLVNAIAEAAPQFVQALGKILVALGKAIVAAAPQLTKAFTAILQLIFKVLRDNFPDLVKTGLGMLISLLKGIRDNIGKVVKMVVSIVSTFVGAIAKNISKIIGAGVTILTAVLKGLASGISKIAKAALDIITKFLETIGNNVRKLINAGGDVIVKFLRGIADKSRDIIRAGGTVIAKVVKGIADAETKIVTAAIKSATKFITTIAKEIPKQVDKVATAIIRMLNALAGVIRKREPEFIGALGNIAASIISGLVAGLDGLGGKLAKKIGDEVKSMPKKALGALGNLVGAAASPKLPVGLGRKFGVSFTSEILEQLRFFDDKFQKQLAKIGGADNIEFLWNLGSSLSGSFMDGLLTGMERTELDPLSNATNDLANQLQVTRGEIESTILESVNKIKKADADVKKIENAKDKAKDIKDKKKRQRRINDLNEELRNVREQRTQVRNEENKTIAAQEQRLKLIKDTSEFIKSDPSYQKQLADLRAAKQKVADLNVELEKYTADLEDLKNKRETLFQQTFDKFSAMPGLVTEDENGKPIDAATQVQNYIASLGGADDAVTKFTGTLDTLDTMGLNKDTYQQLLDIGPAAQGFADALVNLGKDGIAGINESDTNLRNAVQILADHGADEMYAAGIKYTTGLVEGVKVKIPIAVKAAEDLAIAIIKAIKKRLKIKSPSQVMAEIGAYSVEGMANGFSDSSKLVTDAVYGVSDEAKAAIKKSMRGISDIVTDSINPNPTITPILDLSQIQTGAGQLGSLLDIPATASLALASGIFVPGSGGDSSETGQAAPIQFNQYNTSPESLSPIQIYRQTKNQLSQARPVLAS